ncbi:MAG: NifB/NifX family molybdenum-iron cluster-binding protein [Verrucomicrobiia bacterium]
MTIAIPIWQERVSPVLDTAAHFLVVSQQHGQESGRREVILTPLPPEAFSRSIAELHVDVLLCAAVSEPLRLALEQRGTRVFPHLCGPVNEILEAYFRGRLERREFRMPGCWGGHSSHSGGLCQRRSRIRRRAKNRLPRRTPA